MGGKISAAVMALMALAMSLSGCYLGGEVPSGSTFADDGSTEPVSRSLPDDCARKSGSGVPQLCAILEGSERADYTQDFHQRLRVINPLSTSANNVIATLELPPGLALVSADPPATVTEPASWHWAQIRPGETQEVQLVLRGTGPGLTSNSVVVSNLWPSETTVDSRISLLARGALRFSIVDASLTNPVSVGEELVYKLKVSNTSEELAARGVSISISIPHQIAVNSVDAPFNYVVAGDTYTFSGIDISSSSTVLITMNATAKTSGDVRVLLEVSTDAWQGPPGVDSLLLRVIQ